jgi:uncharacterized protein YqhQ
VSETAVPQATDPAVSGNGASPRLRLGGMALRNGLLIHGPTSWAIAARSPDGGLHVASGRKPTFGPSLASVPLLRGPLTLAASCLRRGCRSRTRGCCSPQER